jgi:hypothetical protein
MLGNRFTEEIKNGGGEIVIADADAGDKPRLPIDEAVDDDLEADETCFGMKTRMD